MLRMNYRLGLLFITIALATGCYKDDSIEAVKAVNAISLADENTQRIISVSHGDTLRLHPTIEQTLGTTEADLSFQWMVYHRGNNLVVPDTVVSTARNLDLEIKGVPFTLGENYKLRYIVTDNRTGVKSFLAYDLTIANRFTRGWLLLEDRNGQGDLSMILPDESVVHNIYTERNTQPLIGPRKLELLPFNVSEDISLTGPRLFLIAQQGSQECNYLTLEKKFDYNYLFFIPPVVDNPQRMIYTNTVWGTSVYANLGVAITNGKVHSNFIGGFPGVKKFGAENLTPDGTQDYSVAPYIAQSVNYGATGTAYYNAIVYDNSGKRFFNVGGVALQSFPTTVSDPNAFDMNNVGMEMIFLDSANVVNHHNIVMKSADNQPYLLRLRTQSTEADPIITLEKKLMDAPGILSMNTASGSTRTPHIYYAADNVLQRYEVTSNMTTALHSFGAGEQITFLKYRRAGFTDEPVLLAATWDGTTGKVYAFRVNASGGISLDKTYSGFGKIVDMAYKLPQ